MLDSNGPFPFLAEGLLSDVQDIPVGEYLCDTLPPGQSCPDLIANYVLRVPFGHGSGQGNQENCAKVTHLPTTFCQNVMILAPAPAQSAKSASVRDVLYVSEAEYIMAIHQRPIKEAAQAYQASLPVDILHSQILPPPLDLPDSLTLANILTRHTAIGTLIQNATEDISNILWSRCPECRDATPGPDQLLMLYAYVWWTANAGSGGGSFVPLPWFSGCYPAACSKEDIETNSYLFGDAHGITINGTKNFVHAFHDLSFDGSPSYLPGCTTDQRYNGKWKTENIAIVVVFSMLAFFLAIGTVYDIHSRVTKRKSPPNDVLLSFSLLTNFEFIISTKQSGSDRLGCLEGIRALSMTWVVLGHSFLFSSTFMLVDNKQYTNKVSAVDEDEVGMAFRAIAAGPYSVDTFFFIGATLLSYLLLKDLDKTNGWLNMEGSIHMVLLYVNRIIRITIPYAFMILFLIGIPPLVIQQPIAAASYAQNAAFQCKEHWWQHLLYINNFKEFNANGCLGQSWFLSIDMMFFLASPLIVYPLWLSKFGPVHKTCAYLWWLLCPILSISWLLRCADGILHSGMDLEDAAQEFCWTNVIESLDFAPWGRRCQCYIMGLLAGHILHVTKGKKINISPVLNVIIWQAVLSVFFALVYAPYGTELDNGIENRLQRFWYSSSHLMWGICLTWTVFACCRGLGGIVNDILSWPGWIPISKVSFMTYLVHMDFNWFFFLLQVN